jgi:hypothetical protein
MFLLENNFASVAGHLGGESNGQYFGDAKQVVIERRGCLGCLS